jgi:hypothetical protein
LPFCGSSRGICCLAGKDFLSRNGCGWTRQGAGSEIPLSVPAVNENIESAFTAEDYFIKMQKGALQKDNNRYFCAGPES